MRVAATPTPITSLLARKSPERRLFTHFSRSGDVIHPLLRVWVWVRDYLEPALPFELVSYWGIKIFQTLYYDLVISTRNKTSIRNGSSSSRGKSSLTHWSSANFTCFTYSSKRERHNVKSVPTAKRAGGRRLILTIRSALAFTSRSALAEVRYGSCLLQ